MVQNRFSQNSLAIQKGIKCYRHLQLPDNITTQTTNERRNSKLHKILLNISYLSSKTVFLFLKKQKLERVWKDQYISIFLILIFTVSLFCSFPHFPSFSPYYSPHHFSKLSFLILSPYLFSLPLHLSISFFDVSLDYSIVFLINNPGAMSNTFRV